MILVTCLLKVFSFKLHLPIVINNILSVLWHFCTLGHICVQRPTPSPSLSSSFRILLFKKIMKF